MGVVPTGKRNPNWRGGRTVASNGYVLVRRPGHRLADVRGYVYEHRLVAEEQLGHRLQPGEEVHHINGIKHDNRPENLQVVPSKLAHGEQHRKRRSGRRRHGEQNPLVSCACGCGTEFLKFDSGGRPRLYVSGHNSHRADKRDELGRFKREALLDGREWREFPQVGAR